MDDLRYPIGKFQARTVEFSELPGLIDAISATPANLRTAVSGLSAEQLDTPYRPGGWTVRQVTHHVPDSHINAWVRFRLALTSDDPLIVPYAEARWAELPDARSAPVEVSLALLDSLHERWVRLLRSLDETQWKRTYRHPEMGSVALSTTAALYAWHGRHHVAHVTRLREREGWL